MKKGLLYTYMGLSFLAFLCILIQVFLAGVAVFQDYTYWDFHKTFSLFKYIYFVAFIIALLGRLPKLLTWSAFILFAAANLQYYTAHGFLAPLHLVLPFFIFWLNIVIIKKSFIFKNK